jgi:5-formyltetrahydrofolate cyclo-ligase
MMSSCNKQKVRTELSAIRKSVPEKRRLAARNALISALHPVISSYRWICSFHPLPAEIDTIALNELLASEGRLVLIADVEKQLSLENIDCVLVPALGFDRSNNRIGYGKGYYDRLISQARSASLKTQFIGIGFCEQMSETPLPIEPHDERLDHIFLF